MSNFDHCFINRSRIKCKFTLLLQYKSVWEYTS